MRSMMDDMATSSPGFATTKTTPSSYDYSSSLFTYYLLIAALLAFLITQSIRFSIAWNKEKRWDFKQLLGSGRVPSSHSAIVTALAAAIGFQDGFGGSLFSVALILSCIVMYDAFGGLQAKVLNQIMYLAESRPLRELLEHTPTQLVLFWAIVLTLAVMTSLTGVIASVPPPDASSAPEAGVDVDGELDAPNNPFSWAGILEGLSTLQIVAIIASVVVGLLFIGCLVVYIVRRQGQDQDRHDPENGPVGGQDRQDPETTPVGVQETGYHALPRDPSVLVYHPDGRPVLAVPRASLSIE